MFTKMKASKYRDMNTVFNIVKGTGWWIWTCLNKSRKNLSDSNIAAEEG